MNCAAIFLGHRAKSISIFIKPILVLFRLGLKNLRGRHRSADESSSIETAKSTDTAFKRKVLYCRRAIHGRGAIPRRCGARWRHAGGKSLPACWPCIAWFEGRRPKIMECRWFVRAARVRGNLLLDAAAERAQELLAASDCAFGSGREGKGRARAGSVWTVCFRAARIRKSPAKLNVAERTVKFYRVFPAGKIWSLRSSGAQPRSLLRSAACPLCLLRCRIFRKLLVRLPASLCARNRQWRYHLSPARVRSCLLLRAKLARTRTRSVADVSTRTVRHINNFQHFRKS